MRTVRATRYVTPLREGGSLPAIIEADDERQYVMKFRGAGQGPKALIAELIASSLARHLGFSSPEPVTVELDASLGRNERDPEIRELLLASEGLNAGFDYLAGALNFDPVAGQSLDPQLASDIVWFDAFIMNVDRTVKNPNLLWWRGSLWLIDHGASLYFQHDWASATERAASPFAPIKAHVLLPRATAAGLDAAHARLLPKLDAACFQRAVDVVPEAWVGAERSHYTAWLHARVTSAPVFLEEAKRARAALL
ncbi:MAG: aminotransferase class I and II [Myxococcaceae bacterium]|nr:aminotransferase class I and II [Myxococcaceae bacterium]